MRHDIARVRITQAVPDESDMVLLHGQVVVNGFVEYERAVALLGLGQSVDLIELGGRGPESDGLHLDIHNTSNYNGSS